MPWHQLWRNLPRHLPRHITEPSTDLVHRTSGIIPPFYKIRSKLIRGAGQVWRPFLPSKKSTRATALLPRRGVVMEMGPGSWLPTPPSSAVAFSCSGSHTSFTIAKFDVFRHRVSSNQQEFSSVPPLGSVPARSSRHFRLRAKRLHDERGPHSRSTNPSPLVLYLVTPTCLLVLP